MKRLEGWDHRMVRFNISKLTTSFSWGVFDCCIYPCDVINVITGEDLAADFRGRYDSETEAYRFLASLGYADLGALASSRLPEHLTREGQPAPSMARRGDVVLARGEKSNFLTICDGRSLVGPHTVGLVHVSTALALRAWKVG